MVIFKDVDFEFNPCKLLVKEYLWLLLIAYSEDFQSLANTLLNLQEVFAYQSVTKSSTT